MKKEFVQTENFKRLKATIIAAEQRGAEEAGWVLVVGPPGVGKTTMLRRYAVDSQAIWLSAKPNWNIRYFMDELAEALKIEQKSRTKLRDRDALVIGKIARGQIPIIIDEIENVLKHNHSVLEQIRAISDATETMVILSGMEDDRRQDIQSAIAKAMQFSSRVFKLLVATPATLADVRLMADKLCDIGTQSNPKPLAVEDDLVEAIWEKSDGILRQVKNALSKVESAGRRLKKDRISLADMGEEELCPVWRTAVGAAPRGDFTKKGDK